MTLRTMAVVAFDAPAPDEARPGRELLERIRFGLGSFGHPIGEAEDDVFAWVTEVVVDEQSTLVRVGWTGDEWLVTLDPPPVGPVPRLRGLLGEDPREASERAARHLAADLHAVLGAIGAVRWYTPDEHRPGGRGHPTPMDE